MAGLGEAAAAAAGDDAGDGQSASVSIVPPPLLINMLRVVVNGAVVCSAPLLKTRPPETAPRLASCEIDSVPWLIVHGVTPLCVPVSVQVLMPVFSKFSKPWY